MYNLLRVLGLLSLLFPGISGAATYYVATTGSDGAAGAIGTPWLTINKCATTMVAGDTCYVRGGTYNISAMIIPAHSGSAGNLIVYSAYPGETPIVNSWSGIPTWGAVFFLQNTLSYIKVTGFTINGMNNSGIDDFGIRMDTSNYVQILNNHINNTGDSGMVCLVACDNLIIDSNVVAYPGVHVSNSQEGMSFQQLTNSTISNNTLHDGTWEGIDVKHVANNVNIYGNNVYNMHRISIYIDGQGATASNINIYNNVIHDNISGSSAGLDGIRIGNEGGGLSTGINIYNNVIYNMSTSGINLSNYHSSGGVPPFTNVHIMNNTIYNVGIGATGGGIEVDSGTDSGIYVGNNILDATGNYGIGMTPTGQTVTNNLFYNISASGTNSVTGNPLFVSTSTPDFHIQAGSPAIDAGIATNAPATDITGTTRPQNSLFDIGAYEYVNPVIPPPTPGVVAAYGFEEASGSPFVDSSGYANHGSINTATRTASGHDGKGLVFNGTSSYTTTPSATSLDLTTGVTLEAWVYPTANQVAWIDLVYKGGDDWYLEASKGGSGYPAMSVLGSNIAGTAVLALNTWSHLAGTYDGTNLKIYLNGTQVGIVGKTGTLATTHGTLYLGGDAAFGQYFTGRMDEVRVYNIALTQAQIAVDMANSVAVTNPPNATAGTPQGTQTGTFVSPQTLSWTASTSAVSHNVYFCTDPALVAGGCSKGGQAGTTYSTGTLSPNTTYYWRIDEVNSVQTTTGTIWSFTTSSNSVLFLGVIDVGGGAVILDNGNFSLSGSPTSVYAHLNVMPATKTWTGTGAAWMTINNIRWENTTRVRHKVWQETGASLGTLSIYHSVGDLANNKYYNVKVDGNKFVVTHALKGVEGTYCFYTYCKANGAGNINFQYTDNYSTPHTFDVTLDH